MVSGSWRVKLRATVSMARKNSQKNLAVARPAKLVTRPMLVKQTPHKSMLKVMKTLGLKRLRRALVMGSQRAYETKKMDSAAL